MKQILATNVRALMKHHKQDPAAAAKHLKMHPYQLKRILAGDHYLRMDTVQRIADGYKLEPYQLLLCNLDPNEQQMARVVSPEEDKYLQALNVFRKTVPPGAH